MGHLVYSKFNMKLLPLFVSTTYCQVFKYDSTHYDGPDQGTQPGQPGQPPQPGQPGQPGQPPQPGQPGQPPQPGQPGQPAQADQPVQGGPGNESDNEVTQNIWSSSMLPLESSLLSALDKYGCICSGIQSDTKVRGLPVDEIDRTCFVWRGCHRCNGKRCGGYKLNKFQQCSDTLTGCKRRTCECDMQFVHAIKEIDFNKQHNEAYINYVECETTSRITQHGCCLKSELYTFFNKANRSCCANGDLVQDNSC